MTIAVAAEPEKDFTGDEFVLTEQGRRHALGVIFHDAK